MHCRWPLETYSNTVGHSAEKRAEAGLASGPCIGQRAAANRLSSRSQLMVQKCYALRHCAASAAPHQRKSADAAAAAAAWASSASRPHHHRRCRRSRAAAAAAAAARAAARLAAPRPHALLLLLLLLLLLVQVVQVQLPLALLPPHPAPQQQRRRVRSAQAQPAAEKRLSNRQQSPCTSPQPAPSARTAGRRLRLSRGAGSRLWQLASRAQPALPTPPSFAPSAHTGRTRCTCPAAAVPAAAPRAGSGAALAGLQ